VVVEAFVFVVTTRRFDESLAFYRDLLGLGLVEEWTEFGHGAVLSAGDHAHVELIELDVPDEPPPRHAPFLGLQVDNVDQLHARLTAAGAQIAAPLADRAWGGRGFGVLDPNGVAVNVYSAYERGSGTDQ
jgi:catechol 2,3-dioxygenase-like lactoylglutathione lyase family enzyme